MGVLFDYFRAGTDDEAVAVYDWPAGPTCPPEGTEPKDSAELKGIDPHVMMGTLEALLTGHRYEDITDRPVAEMVGDLRDLAVRAVRQEQHLYCWMSL